MIHTNLASKIERQETHQGKEGKNFLSPAPWNLTRLSSLMYPQVTFSLFTHSSPACALEEKECTIFANQSEQDD